VLFRSKRLYEEGKSKCDGYTVRSKHQDWLAVDLGIITDDGKDILWTDDRYAKLGELAEGVGLVWGGSWNAFGGGDVYHVELCDDI
jgi:hypothetical protein